MSAPSTIAHYRITSKLGEGGMGAVYRATDTKLNRDVAIKVLPESFAADPDRLARFTREAQVLASLNHSNIAAIYGVEERSLVLELVEGSEPKGPLSAEEALPLIQQLADALEYAHEKGIVHRDLKPANLKITPQGTLKVLDFGLAKAMTGDVSASGANEANSPTLTMRATMAGVIMGTAAYMSPEQARGQDVDKRADIWSFGVVVYELLTGAQLFAGPTVSDTLAAVLRHDVDFTAIPARFRKLLRLCLTRDPRQRLRDISAVRLLLEETPPVATAAPRGARPWAWIAIATVSTIAAAAAGWGWYRARGTNERPLMRFDAELAPDGVRSTNQGAVLSPDGKRIVFRMRTPDGFMLATRGFDQAGATVLPGTESAGYAFFSPDSQWLAFFAGGKLKKVSMQGGSPVTLCDAQLAGGGTWLDDGRIVAAVNAFNLTVVPAAGGQTQDLANKAGRPVIYRLPQALPGNRVLVGIADTGLTNNDLAEIVTVQIPSGEVKTVLRGGYGARYVPTGHLLFIRQGTLYGVRFDPESATTRGDPVPLQEDVAANPSLGAGRFDFNSRGTLTYQSGKPVGGEQPLGVLDTDGKVALAGRLTGTSLRVSPDGQRFAYVSGGDLQVYDTARDASTRLTFDPAGSNRHPVWSPDGKYLAYSASGAIWWTRADGAGKPVAIFKSSGAPVAGSMVTADRPHMLRLVFHHSTRPLQRSIQIMDLDLADLDKPVVGSPAPFLDIDAAAIEPAFSPDGRWLVYVVTQADQSGIFVERYFPGKPSSGGGKWQITTNGRFPVWARNGKQLLYRTPDSIIMVADYTTSGDTFSASRPRPWSPRNIYNTGLFQDFDIFPDGKRAIAVLNNDATTNASSAPKATFLVNFFDELKRKLP
jgi:Tol biopolymer transport system component